MLKEEKIREISKSINEIREDIIDYRQIYQCASMLFDAIFGLDTIFESGSKLPVDIRKIASELGFEMFPATVSVPNQDSQDKDSKIPCYIATTVTVYYPEKKNITFINEAKHEYYRRLAIAIHIYYYLKHYYDKDVSVSSPLMPCKYNAMEEIIAKIFARMILLPPYAIADEFYLKYNGEYDNFPGCENQWYEHLSIVAEVSKAEAVIGWQEARIILKLLN